MRLSNIVNKIRTEWIKSIKVGTLLESIGHTAYGRASGDIIRLDRINKKLIEYTIVKPNKQATNRVPDRQNFMSAGSVTCRFRLAECD